MRFLRGVRAMYAYCRVGHGYPNSRWYSLKTAILWSKEWS